MIGPRSARISVRPIHGRKGAYDIHSGDRRIGHFWFERALTGHHITCRGKLVLDGKREQDLSTYFRYVDIRRDLDWLVNNATPAGS